MREVDVRDLLEVSAGGEAPPSGVDLDRAVRDGRRTRTTRRAFLAGGTALGVSAVLGATAALRSTARRPDPGWTWPPPVYGPHGGPALPAVPDGFDLFGQWAVFGWLPFTPQVLSSSVEAETFGIEAEGDQVIRFAMLGPVGAADELARKGVVEDAPPVAGNPARWISTRGSTERESLQWQFAGIWAQVSTVDVRQVPLAELRAMLHRVASGTGLSATRRQRFPFRTGAVPDGIPLTRVRLALTAAGHWDVSVHGGATYGFAISLTNVPVSTRTIEPSIYVDPAIPSSVPPVDQTIRDEVDGLPGVYVRNGENEFVRVFRPDGVTVTVSARFDALRQLGPDGVLGLYRTIEVLPDPATWTDRPV